MNAVKKILAYTLALTVLISTAGCIFPQAIDAAYVTEKMLEATAKTPTIKSDSACVIDLSIGAEDNDSLSLQMDMTVETITSQDPLNCYTSTVISTELMGNAIEFAISSYLVEESGEYVVYTFSDFTGNWSQSVADQKTLDAVKGIDYSFLTEKAAKDLILKEETETIGDHTVYVLTTTVTGDELVRIFDELGIGDLANSEMDLGALTVPVEIYADTETFLPIRMVTQIEGLSEALTDAAQSTLDGDMFGIAGDYSMGALITDFTYEGVEVPPLPAEARPSV